MIKKIKDLVANKRNPRKITDKKLEMLKASIKEFGDLSGIIDNVNLNRLEGGHQRIKAIPEDADIIIEKRFDPPTESGTVAVGHVKLGTETMRYRQVNWDEIKATAAMIAANKHSGEWDLQMLNDHLLELDANNYHMPLTGFTDTELEDLMAPISKDGLIEDDEVPDADFPEPVAKLGDVYKLGEHRLMCGSSTDRECIQKLINKNKIDMVFTDPPYGMSAVSKSGVLSANYSGDILGDKNTDVARDSYNLAMDMFEGAHHVWWGANYYCSHLKDAECWIVWDKNNGGSDQTDCELAWTNFRSVVRQFTQASEKTNRVHPTQKPCSLIEWVFDKFKFSEKNVIDLFGGSGSTLIACEKTNRKCFMMELDPHYVDVIIARWEKFTGKKAELING